MELEIATRDEWRVWLEKHAATVKEVWLVYNKKTSGRPRIAYEDAVEEAICFGWIDGKISKIDLNRYKQRFTPRKPTSRWSAINIGRATRLIRAKKMTAAGLAVFHPERKTEAHPTELPVALEKEFRRYSAAWKNFQAFPPSYRRMTVAWVASARKEETQRTRLRTLMEKSAENQRIKFM